MHRILLFGDTHGRIDRMSEVILASQGVDYYIHLGDLCRDAEELEAITGKRILTVRGNNDFFEPGIPDVQLLSVEGHGIYTCHGHKVNVYRQLTDLAAEARRNQCDLAFFGHTHMWTDAWEGEVHCISPGSPSWPRDGHRSYALISLDGDQVEVERVLL